MNIHGKCINTFLVLISFLFTISLSAQPSNETVFSLIKIRLENKSEIISLLKKGILFNDYQIIKEQSGQVSLLAVTTDVINKNLKNRNVEYKIEVDDMSKFYTERSARKKYTDIRLQKKSVSDFDLGSMGGFYTYDEVVAYLDELRGKYPDLISGKQLLGYSYEDREIWAVKISDNPDNDENEPQVLYDALHHAREPQGMMGLLYFMTYLLENYGTDPEATYLINERELYFVPVVNPDGYEYNNQTNPNGGGMWRKNRCDNGDGSYGVDLNRNYGYKWGYDDLGSNGTPSSEVFRGKSAFSEPETAAMADFILNKNIKVGSTIHTFGDIYLYAYGYSNVQPDDLDIYNDFCSDMSKYNDYPWGTPWELLYFSNGRTQDWQYHEMGIINIEPEIGGPDDGFWPSPDRIIPLAEKHIGPNLYLAHAPGGLTCVEKITFSKESILSGDTAHVSGFIYNKGLSGASNIKLELKSVSTFVTVLSEDKIISFLPARESQSIPGEYLIMVDENTPAGSEHEIEFTTYQNDIKIFSSKYSFKVGHKNYLFEDKCEDININWTTTGNLTNNIWGTTEKKYNSPPASFADSPDDNYPDKTNSSLILKEPVNLSNLSNVFLMFSTRFEIEKSFDYGQVLASKDGGKSWIPLSGKYTSIAAGQTQPLGEPVYQGNRKSWSEESIDLSEFIDESILIKFTIGADDYINQDGWYIDDIKIISYSDNIVGISDEVQPYQFSLKQNYPNPFNPETTIQYSVPSNGNAEYANVVLKIFDLLGREIKTLVNKEQLPGTYKISFEAGEISSGIYFYKIISGEYSETKKMLLLR